jgi:hypothetical protein
MQPPAQTLAASDMSMLLTATTTGHGCWSPERGTIFPNLCLN